MTNLALFHCLSEYGCDAHGHRITHIPNVAAYAGRGMVIPARLAFMPDRPGTEEGYAYLHHLGLGPQEVCVYPNGASLFDGVRASCHALKRAVRHAEEDGDAELYIAGPEGWRFLKEIGFRENRILNQPLQLRRQTDKVGLRRLAGDLELLQVFPAHTFGRTREQIKQEARRLFNAGCERVVVKHPDLASGEGQYVLQSPDDFRTPKAETFFRTYVNGEIEFVVEEWWGGNDFSAVFTLRERGWTLDFLSGQFMRAVDAVTHLGNCVGSEPEDTFTGPYRSALVSTLRADLHPLLKELSLRGYRGKICFDGKWRVDGHYKLFEANARPSASIFPGSVMRQVMLPGERIAASMLAVNLEHALSIEQALDLFGVDAYDAARRRGVLIGNPISLVDPHHPKLTIITVANTVLASVAQAIEIKRRFEGRQFDEVIVPTHLHHELTAS